MSDWTDAVETGMSVVRGCLVISVQSELHQTTIRRMQADMLDQIKSTGVSRAVFDLSTVPLLDSVTFTMLADAARMCLLLGVDAVFVEFRPEVVSALVNLDVDMTGIRTARTMEDGLRLLGASWADQESSDTADEPDSDEIDGGPDEGDVLLPGEEEDERSDPVNAGE